MDRLHVATLNILNLADRWPERLPLLLADTAALQPDLLGRVLRQEGFGDDGDADGAQCQCQAHGDRVYDDETQIAGPAQPFACMQRAARSDLLPDRQGDEHCEERDCADNRFVLHGRIRYLSRFSLAFSKPASRRAPSAQRVTIGVRPGGISSSTLTSRSP